MKAGDVIRTKNGEVGTLVAPGNADATWWFVDFDGIEDEVHTDEMEVVR